MSNTATGAQRSAQHEQRLAWLTVHPDLLARLPGANDDVEPAQSEALDEALRAMSLIRLYAPTAARVNTRWSIRGLVSQIRGEHVGK
jgi:hypothetical protein